MMPTLALMRIMMKLVTDPVNNKHADKPSSPEVIAAGIVNQCAQLAKSQMRIDIPDLLMTALLFASQEADPEMRPIIEVMYTTGNQASLASISAHIFLTRN